MKKVIENNKIENKSLKPLNTLGSFFAAGLLLFGAASCSQGGETQDNAVATEEEFDETVGVEGTQNTEQVTNTDADAFNQYDRNTDRMWDRDEFNANLNESRMFNNWDADRDGSINENEYNQGTSNWQGQNTGTQGTTTGTTGTTTNTTATTGTTNNNVGKFSDWDTNRDGKLDQDEFSQGTFNTWDTDRNGNVSTEEYNMYNGRIGTGTNGSGTNTGTGTGTDTNTDRTGTGTTGGSGTGSGAGTETGNGGR